MLARLVLTVKKEKKKLWTIKYSVSFIWKEHWNGIILGFELSSECIINRYDKKNQWSGGGRSAHNLLYYIVIMLCIRKMAIVKFSYLLIYFRNLMVMALHNFLSALRNVYLLSINVCSSISTHSLKFVQ